MTAEDLIKGLIALGFDGDYKDDDLYPLEDGGYRHRERVVLECPNYNGYRIRVVVDWITVKRELFKKRESGGWEKYGSTCYVDGKLYTYDSVAKFMDDFISEIKKEYSL